MKKPSPKDIALLVACLITGLVVGWCLSAMWHNKPAITIENPVNTALIKHSDSLEAVVAQRNLAIANNDKEQFSHDSTLIMNNKTLAKEYDKIKNLDDSSRSAYVELALKRANIRHR